MGTVAAGIAILGGLYCGISNITNANNASATSVTLTVPENISVSANPAAENGFVESEDNENNKVAITTGNQAGYTLSIKAKDAANGNDLINEQDKSSKLTSITTNLTSDQYKNGDYINTWGFKSDVVNSQANSNYLPGPTTDGILLAKTNSNNKDGDTFKFAIATKVNNEVAAGNYSNNFVLTATGNTLKYTIRFNNNGGTGGPAAPQEGTIGDADLEVQINSETPSMQGKDFLGWCTKQPKEDGSCTGVVVQPAGCFPLCKCDLDLTLWAMYGKKDIGGGSDNGGTGSSTQFNCGGLSNNSVSNITDYQGKNYRVKKIGDVCWMWTDLMQGNAQMARSACENLGPQWNIPTEDQANSLVNTVGSGSELSKEGWSGDYWTNTPSYGYWTHLHIEGSNAQFDNWPQVETTTYKIRCVSQ